jgi:hypothetical protein
MSVLWVGFRIVAVTLVATSTQTTWRIVRANPQKAFRTPVISTHVPTSPSHREPLVRYLFRYLNRQLKLTYYWALLLAPVA